MIDLLDFEFPGGMDWDRILTRHHGYQAKAEHKITPDPRLVNNKVHGHAMLISRLVVQDSAKQ